jgi:carbon-monoxide dehydrogenase medium subunit
VGLREELMLPEFDLLMPETLPEALALLAEGARKVTPVSGGTNLIVDLRGGRRRPGTLMNISGMDGLCGIRREDGHLVIGGGVTVAGLLDEPLVTRHASILKNAASVFGSPLVRNRATVGGNLADASPAADLAPPLLALDAEVELASAEGKRRVPLEEFMVGVRETLLEPQELLVAVRCPTPPPHSAGAFYKLGLRKADAVSVVSAAVMVEGDGDGHCRQARIALGAVAPRPIRARAAEDLLRGRPLDPATIAEAARLATESASPIDDIRGSAAYRRRMIGVLVRRLLAAAAGDSRE